MNGIFDRAVFQLFDDSRIIFYINRCVVPTVVHLFEHLEKLCKTLLDVSRSKNREQIHLSILQFYPSFNYFTNIL